MYLYMIGNKCKKTKRGKKMDKNNRKKLVKDILSGKLNKAKIKEYAGMKPVEKEIEKQWEYAGKSPVSLEVKENIWKAVKKSCKLEPTGTIHIKFWQLISAAAVILLVIGSFWHISVNRNSMEEFVEIIARGNEYHILPDSSKVWMQPGSHIRYCKAFDNDRKVWLQGNSLFEVHKHAGSKFRVYIDRAYIEVKGTCFLVKQNDATKNEITLFHGAIEFNVELTGQKTELKPLQKILYNPVTAQTQMEEIKNINWHDGKYKFTDIPLVKLIETVNQMYGSSITIDESVSNESAFTGSIRYDEPLEDVISKICFSLNLRYEQHNNEMIIMN